MLALAFEVVTATRCSTLWSLIHKKNHDW